MIFLQDQQGNHVKQQRSNKQFLHVSPGVFPADLLKISTGLSGTPYCPSVSRNLDIYLFMFMVVHFLSSYPECKSHGCGDLRIVH